MKLARDQGTATYRVRAYEPGWIQVNQETYEQSVLLAPDRLSTDVSARTIAELSGEDLQAAAELEPEILLLGTGERQAFPERALMRTLIGSGIGFEAMDTAAACRTFNVLVSEGRHACALLLLR